MNYRILRHGFQRRHAREEEEEGTRRSHIQWFTVSGAKLSPRAQYPQCIRESRRQQRGEQCHVPSNYSAANIDRLQQKVDTNTDQNQSQATYQQDKHDVMENVLF